MNDSAATPYVLRPDELLLALVRLEDRAPLGLIEAAVAHGDAMAAALADVIDGELAWDGESDGEWWLLLHAAMILGRIPTPAAGLLLVRLLCALNEHGEEDMQDWLDGDWPALFANKPPSVIAALTTLVDDHALDWSLRSQVQDVLLDAARREGALALEAAIDGAATRAMDADDNANFRDLVANTLLGFPRQRHRALLESFVRDATPYDTAGCFDLKDIEHAYAENRDDPAWLLRNEPWAFYAPDAITARQQRWREESQQADDAFHSAYDDLPVTHVRVTPRLGRNDACHCGSGKKYKRCCLAKDEIAEREARAHPF